MRICGNCFELLEENPEECPRCGTRRPSIGWEAEAYLGLVVADQYEVVQRLGAGLSGVVYLANDVTATGDEPSRVAIKFLHRRYVKDESLRARFHREALVTSRLDHPNIARTHSFGELDDGTPYIVMDYVDGVALDIVMTRHGTLPVSDAVHIAMEIGAALAAAHEAGVVHRDLKPGNVFVRARPDGSPEVRILDFGFAYIKSQQTGQQRLTRTGMIVGSPYYMAPEQTESRSTVDGRADLYSLGVILYRMLAGRPPLEADNIIQLIEKHRTEQPTPVERASRQPVPAPLAALVMRLLEKRPEDRPQTADETCTALRTALQQPSASPTEQDATPDATSQRTPPENRRAHGARLVLWVAFAVAAGVAVVLTLLLSR